MKTLDMRFIRYLNLFERITRVRTKNCFFYNNLIVFAVPRANVSRAIGREGRNVKRISEIIKKRIKIVVLPHNINDAEEFLSEVVEPVAFKNIEINGDEIIINAGRQSKAALIGRDKVRLKEMKDIVKEYFNKSVRIV